MAEGQAHAVRGQGAAGGLGPADGLAVHDPGLVPDVGIDERAPVGRWEGGAALGADESRPGGDVDQAVWAGRHPGGRGRAPPAGAAVRHVGLGAPSAGPGMEPPHPAAPAADAPGLARPCLSGVCRAPHEAVVAGVLVTAGQPSACRRARPGHQAGRPRPPETRLVCQPWRGLVLRARGTVPVRPGGVAVGVRWAGLTRGDLAAAGRRAAPLPVLQGPQRTRPPPVAPWRTGPGALEAANLGALHPHRSPRRRLRASAPRCCALAGRCVSTRVVGGERGPSDACRSRRLPPASRRWGAPEGGRVGPAAWWWRPLAWRAALHAPGTRRLGRGAVAVDRALPPRPGAGESSTGGRGVTPDGRSRARGRCGQGPARACPPWPGRLWSRLRARVPRQRGALLQAPTTGVARGEADSVAQPAATAEPRSHRCEAQAPGPCVLARGAPNAEGRPGSVAGVRADERAAAQGQRAGAPRVLLDLLAGPERRSEVFRGEPVWGLGIGLRPWAYGPDVSLLGTCRPAPALTALEHALAPLGQGETSSDVGHGSPRTDRAPGLATA